MLSWVLKKIFTPNFFSLKIFLQWAVGEARHDTLLPSILVFQPKVHGQADKMSPAIGGQGKEDNLSESNWLNWCDSEATHGHTNMTWASRKHVSTGVKTFLQKPVTLVKRAEIFHVSDEFLIPRLMKSSNLKRTFCHKLQPAVGGGGDQVQITTLSSGAGTSSKKGLPYSRTFSRSFWREGLKNQSLLLVEWPLGPLKSQPSPSHPHMTPPRIEYRTFKLIPNHESAPVTALEIAFLSERDTCYGRHKQRGTQGGSRILVRKGPAEFWPQGWSPEPKICSK